MLAATAAPSTLFAADQSVHYNLHKEVITINYPEAGYTSSVYCRGKFSTLENRETDIVYTELESIGELTARYLNSGRKYKDLKEENVHNTSAMGTSFYNGMNKYVLSWPFKGNPELHFLYAYKLNCKELMTLSTLMINDIQHTDTFEYDVRVPKGMLLYFRIPAYAGSLHTDSTETSEGKIYHFRACPSEKITLPKELEDYESYNYAPRIIRLIVVPLSYRAKAWACLNNWFNGTMNENHGLNPASLQILDAVVKKASDPDTIASRIFNYVKTRTTYIDVENGLGAFRPRDENDVLLKRQGDCKDMANLLCEALKHYGVDAYKAISSTLSHECKMDFPSLASGNHMICVVRQRDKWIFLDATDPVCMYGFPSMHIQGTGIYRIDDKGGEWIAVPKVPLTLNRSSCEMNLVPVEYSLAGSVSYCWHGLSRHDALQLKFSESPADFILSIHKILENTARNTSFSTLTETETDSATCFKGDMKAANKLALFDGKHSVDLNFLPFPHKYPKKANPGTRIITYQTLDNRFSCRISTGKKIKLKPVEPVSFDKDGFRFDFKAEQTNEQTITVSYSYSYNDVLIPAEKTKSYFELNALIEYTLNQMLIYTDAL